MASAASRATALGRLAAAYTRHQVRRWSGRGSREGALVAERIYTPENYVALTAEERQLMPAISRCINCGICALVAGRLGNAYLPDLSSAYLRPLHLLPRVAGDVQPAAEGEATADLEAAAAACPVGVPLPAVAAIVRRLARL